METKKIESIDCARNKLLFHFIHNLINCFDIDLECEQIANRRGGDEKVFCSAICGLRLAINVLVSNETYDSIVHPNTHKHKNPNIAKAAHNFDCQEASANQSACVCVHWFLPFDLSLKIQ